MKDGWPTDGLPTRGTPRSAPLLGLLLQLHSRDCNLRLEILDATARVAAGVEGFAAVRNDRAVVRLQLPAFVVLRPCTLVGVDDKLHFVSSSINLLRNHNRKS